MIALGQIIRPMRLDGYTSRVPATSLRLVNIAQQSGRLTVKTSDEWTRRPSKRAMSGIQELDRVRLLADVKTGDGVLPLGSTGTAVYRYRDGEAFEVEFTIPFNALLTLRTREIEPIGG